MAAAGGIEMAAYDFVAAALAGIAETGLLLSHSGSDSSDGGSVLLTRGKSPGQRLAANVDKLHVDEPDVTLSPSSTSAAPR
jgi:hypothetical protein